MTINALNSGARVSGPPDQEDASTPHWTNVVGGQVNLYDAIRGFDISYTSPEEARTTRCALTRRLATIVMPRPRGWHLDERHIEAQRLSRPWWCAFVDFGLYFFHNAQELLAKGSGPYFYLPKMDNYILLRRGCGTTCSSSPRTSLAVPQGTIRTTLRIETIPAVFEMEEILYELRDHVLGTQCRPLGLPLQRDQVLPRLGAGVRLFHRTATWSA